MKYDDTEEVADVEDVEDVEDVGHLPLLLRPDQGVLLLVLVQNRDLVIKDFVVHPNNRGNQPEYFTIFHNQKQ